MRGGGGGVFATTNLKTGRLTVVTLHLQEGDQAQFVCWGRGGGGGWKLGRELGRG